MVATVAAILLMGQAPPQHEYPPEVLEQLEAVRAATDRFHDHAVAVAEGYERAGNDGPLMGEHWGRRDLVDKPLDIVSPSTLQYLKIDGEYILTGVAYTVYRAPDEPMPEGFAGDMDVWHLHDMMKISMTATEGRPVLRWITERRGRRRAQRGGGRGVGGLPGAPQRAAHRRADRSAAGRRRASHRPQGAPALACQGRPPDPPAFHPGLAGGPSSRRRIVGTIGAPRGRRCGAPRL